MSTNWNETYNEVNQIEIFRVGWIIRRIATTVAITAFRIIGRFIAIKKWWIQRFQWCDWTGGVSLIKYQKIPINCQNMHNETKIIAKLCNKEFYSPKQCWSTVISRVLLRGRRCRRWHWCRTFIVRSPLKHFQRCVPINVVKLK